MIFSINMNRCRSIELPHCFKDMSDSRFHGRLLPGVSAHSKARKQAAASSLAISTFCKLLDLLNDCKNLKSFQKVVLKNDRWQSTAGGQLKGVASFSFQLP